MNTCLAIIFSTNAIISVPHHSTAPSYYKAVSLTCLSCYPVFIDNSGNPTVTEGQHNLCISWYYMSHDLSHHLNINQTNHHDWNKHILNQIYVYLNYSGRAWIGLDKHTAGDWRWTDGSRINATWNGWQIGEPQTDDVRAVLRKDGSWEGHNESHHDYFACERCE